VKLHLKISVRDGLGLGYCVCGLGPGVETKSYTVTGTTEPVVRGVEVDMVMRSVTLASFLCAGMGCVIGEGSVVAFARR